MESLAISCTVFLTVVRLGPLLFPLKNATCALLKKSDQVKGPKFAGCAVSVDLVR